MARLVVDGMSVLKTLAGQAAHLDRGYSYSFLTQVTAAVKKFKPRGVDVCWEGGFSRRTQLLPGYKANRLQSTDALHDEREELKKLLNTLGVDQYVAPGHEADDMIASLVNTREGEHVIMSGDKDMLQLVSHRVSVFQKVRTVGSKSERRLITKSNFQDCTGWPDPAVYLKAHCALGDGVDCIPKVVGVGPGMIHAYWLGMDIPPRKRQILDDFYNNSSQYRLNKQLIDLTRVGHLDHQCTAGHWREDLAYHILCAMQFNSYSSKFHTWILPWHEACAHADVPSVS